MLVFANLSIVSSIAIANGFSAVTNQMYEAQVKACQSIEIEAQHGFKAYRKDGKLYLVAFGKDGWLETDKVNDIYGEENVIIHDCCDSGTIFEITA